VLVAALLLQPHVAFATDCQQVIDCLGNDVRGSIAALSGVTLLIAFMTAPDIFGSTAIARAVTRALGGTDQPADQASWTDRALGVLPSRAIEAGDTALRGEQVLDRAAASGRAEPVELTAEHAQQVTREFQEIGGDPQMLRINQGSRTAYLDGQNAINVRGDVFPNSEATTPNATLSSRAALAHELGHANFDVPKTDPNWLPPGNIDDETRVSIWAAQNVPGLSLDERASLILDAQQRGGVIPDAYRSFVDDTMAEFWSKRFGG
jgi:hypothetical protein